MNGYPTNNNVISELCDIYGLHNFIDQSTCFKSTTFSFIEIMSTDILWRL